MVHFANKVATELGFYLSWRIRWVRRRALEGCIMPAKFSNVQTFPVSHTVFGSLRSIDVII
jgi:hypothetical protein